MQLVRSAFLCCARPLVMWSFFDCSMGHAAFVSHQWLAEDHPDTDFKQMQVLQDALKRLMSSSESLPLDIVEKLCAHGKACAHA